MTIDPAQAKALFLASLDTHGPERAAYLDAACGDDPALRQRIEAMLHAHEASGELLVGSPAELLADGSDAEATATLWSDAKGPGTAASADEALAFLALPSRPGSLGRLGHYHVQEVVGKGGFGIVLKAFDEKLHRVVAIKVLAPELAAHASARKRFIREARAAAAVTHEHIVAIHAIEEEHRPPYIVMQFVDGVSLQDKLNNTGPLELRAILRIGLQIASGLAAARKHGLVHRDIKPANILLENGIERVKITDFGLARLTDDASVTQSGTVAGTPMYMSPEQANGETVDHRSDLFSLGTVLYAMCTGRPPFRASSSLAVLKRVCEDTPTPVQQVNAEIPDWLAAVITKLHAKKPDERFQSAQEVAELLGERLAQLQQSSHARAPTAMPVSAVATPRRRWETVLPIAAGVLMVAIVLMVRFWPRGDKANIPVDPTPPPARQVWQCIGSEMDGVKLPEEETKRWRFVIEGDRYWHEGTPAAQGGTFKIDRTKTPNTIDFFVTDGRYKGTTFRGIWEENGDTVRVNAAYGSDERPTDFTTKSTGPNSGQGMWTMKRVSAAIDAKEKSAGQWVQLFNGKDLDGWKRLPEEAGAWTVKDGVLASTGTNSLLFRENDFEHFHLRMEAQINDGGNASVLFHMPEAREMPHGCKVQINSTYKDATRTGSLFNFSAGGGNRVPALEPPPKPGEWFTLDILSRGERIVVQVDGKTVVDNNEIRTPRDAKLLGLQSAEAGTVLQVRKMEITELPAE